MDADRELAALDADVIACRRCPRLVAWREQVAREKRAAFRDWDYWGRAVPGFGPADARLVIVGLAPAAHGANRTGRMFTGDRSGDVLFASLYRTGFASQPESVAADDGMRLLDARMTAPVKCAPPENKPTPAERDTCAPFLARELDILTPRVFLALGAFGWRSLFTTLEGLGWTVPKPRPAFAHGARADVVSPDGEPATVLASYHVSQQNTFTGRLTPDMLDDVLRTARRLIDET